MVKSSFTRKFTKLHGEARAIIDQLTARCENPRFALGTGFQICRGRKTHKKRIRDVEFEAHTRVIDASHLNK